MVGSGGLFFGPPILQPLIFDLLSSTSYLQPLIFNLLSCIICCKHINSGFSEPIFFLKKDCRETASNFSPHQFTFDQFALEIQIGLGFIRRSDNQKNLEFSKKCWINRKLLNNLKILLNKGIIIKKVLNYHFLKKRLRSHLNPGSSECYKRCFLFWEEV